MTSLLLAALASQGKPGRVSSEYAPDAATLQLQYPVGFEFYSQTNMKELDKLDSNSWDRTELGELMDSVYFAHGDGMQRVVHPGDVQAIRSEVRRLNGIVKQKMDASKRIAAVTDAAYQRMLQAPRAPAQHGAKHSIYSRTQSYW